MILRKNFAEITTSEIIVKILFSEMSRAQFPSWQNYSKSFKLKGYPQKTPLLPMQEVCER